MSRPATLEDVEQIVAARVAELERRLDGPRALTVRQVAERISLSVTRVNELIHAGEIRSYKIGHARRVDPDDLSAFLAGRRRHIAAPPVRAARTVTTSSGWGPGILERLCQ